jgi:hypothetical protein
VLAAVLVAASTGTSFEMPIRLRFSSSPIDWVDDWAILAVDSPDPLPVLVAVHSGADFDSNFCRLFCGTCPVALRLVNVATVRREAERQGLHLGSSP